MLVSAFELAATSRADVPEAERVDCYLYADEFQHFATESFTSILSEARKYRLALSLFHQYEDQLAEPILRAVFGNVGTLIVFQVGQLAGQGAHGFGLQPAGAQGSLRRAVARQSAARKRTAAGR